MARRYHVHNIWHISDHHFGDADMIRRESNGFSVRDFTTTTEMDEYIVARHNSVVRPIDKVYFHGDLAFGKSISARERCADLVRRMNGNKRLILGNHDEFDARFYRTIFEKVMAYRLFTEPGAALVCTHIPLHPASLGGKYKGCTINVHGHMHSGDLRDPRYFNICAERVDYTPIHYDWLMDKARALGRAPRVNDYKSEGRM